MSNSTPKLGDRVKCRITGFVGIIISHAQHLTGCGQGKQVRPRPVGGPRHAETRW